ncbi:MAG TPA: hypothetical protein VEB42_10515 [Chitinophagaceae bacterium]|nr:hypothetical protein [Chitinophagaceae bacterium]
MLSKVGESPVEFFREKVEAALKHQHCKVNELASFYVVNLLASFAFREFHPDPVGTSFCQALQTGGSKKRDGLRQVGDVSLFIAGFFSDSLKRKLVDVDYYTQVGSRAYAILSDEHPSNSKMFGELSLHFCDFVSVLDEVSQETHLTDPTNILRQYEKWVQTGNRQSAELLARAGICPVKANRIVQ